MNYESVRVAFLLTVQDQESWMFADPVDTRKYPDYTTLVNQPMHLKEVSRRAQSLDKSKDPRRAKVLFDLVVLVFQNAMVYNPPYSRVHQTSLRLLLTFVSIATHGPPGRRAPPPALTARDHEAARSLVLLGSQ